MKLLIISNMAHYYQGGQLLGHGATAREISHLGSIFDDIVHIGCLYPGAAPNHFLPYQVDNIRLIPLVPTGGKSLREKTGIVKHAVGYTRAILRELPNADVVHVRAPANIPLLALMLLSVVRRPKRRWFKYAGNWKPKQSDTWTNHFQRWWLSKNLSRGLVTVNGQWQDMPAHLHTFLNPCLTSEELAAGKDVASKKTLDMPIQLLFVGRLDTAKGADRALSIAAELRQVNIDFVLEIIGDSPEKTEFLHLAQRLGVSTNVHFRGWLPRHALDEYYSRTHFLLLPSSSEGWPKVLSEAMAFGAVPIASSVGSIPQYLTRFKTGRSLDAYDIVGYTNALSYYVRNPEKWKIESRNSVVAAELFGYTRYLEAVCNLLGITRTG